jgi:hypothetical protein
VNTLGDCRSAENVTVNGSSAPVDFDEYCSRCNNPLDLSDKDMADDMLYAVPGSQRTTAGDSPNNLFGSGRIDYSLDVPLLPVLQYVPLDSLYASVRYYRYSADDA